MIELPAAITHYYHALRVQKNNTPKSMDAFLWGAQGPDFLYYHRLFQPFRENLRTMGSRLHHDAPSRLLSVMRDYQQTRGDERSESYLSGFLCHYSLDRTAHPFVYWNVRTLRKKYPGRGDGFLHNHVESVLDGIILRSITGTLANDFDLRITVPENKEAQESVMRLYSYVLERLYGVHNQENELLHAMADCRKICGFLNDKWMIKKPVAEALEKLTKKYLVSSVIRGISEQDEFDYANILHSEWKSPEKDSTVRKESFFDLFDLSVQESRYFLHEFETADLTELTHDIPFC
ncbi:hypothetical protein CAFE_37240 [Caprobacter fermentans]|uniref:Phospholipase C/D domain-containing protein n=1 Tax=Caproicibacter fermentans TaxID=2576756 RepID=A0A6N8I4B0_9FIRM|nr:zinc dependent phospholipase C family protein [Caproicibacter fermentans]MVB12971.1 hypothetical protein [Caproicibacter fermentans]